MHSKQARLVVFDSDVALVHAGAMNTRDVVHLPDAPALPGLWFRRFRDADDYAQMARVHERSRAWDRVDVHSAREHIPTAEELAVTFPEAEICGHVDLLLALSGDQVVGYSHVRWRWTEITGTRVYLHLGYLVPEWRGKRIGTSLLHWSQQRIREIAADERHPGPTMFATNVSSTEREADALMQHEGYSAVRRLSDMVLEPLAPAPVFPLPAGVRLQPLEPGQYRAVYDAWKDAFAGLWSSTPASEEDYEEFLADNMDVSSFDPTLYHIAWGGDHVAGLVFSRIRNGIGMIPEVAVRRR